MLKPADIWFAGFFYGHFHQKFTMVSGTLKLIFERKFMFFGMQVNAMIC